MNNHDITENPSETLMLAPDSGYNALKEGLGGARCLEHPKYFSSYKAFVQNDFKEAGRLLKELIEEFPDNGRFLNDLGICCYLGGKVEPSRELLTAAVKILGKKSAPYVNLRYIFDQKRFPDLREDFQGHHYRVREDQANFSDALVSIIILEYNNPELTLQCLRSIKSWVGSVPWEVILIDNSEVEPGVDYGETVGMTDIVYHKNENNVGFAAGCNQGAALAKGQFLYFVNNDTSFQKGCVEALAKVLLLDEEVGVVGSKLLYADGTIQHAGVVFDFLNLMPKHRCHSSMADDPSANVALELQAVTAASLMIRRELFGEVGGFPEDYFNGYEDVELCLKVIEAGYKVVYNPQSVLYHFESQSKGRLDHEEANRQRFQERWEGHLRSDELACMAPKDNVVLCYTEKSKKQNRQTQIFSLFAFLDRNHPEIIDMVPLCFFERTKHLRFRKCCAYLFYSFARRGRWEAARVIYAFFLKRQWFRLKYIREMRATLLLGRQE